MKIQKNVRKCKQLLMILILGIVCMMSGRMQGGVVQAAWAGTVDDTYLTEGNFTYYVTGETTVAICGYSGSNPVVEIPRTIDGKTVTRISRGYSSKFAGFDGLTGIIIPDSITSIDYSAFEGLTSISVDANNKVYDSRDNCNAIIETSSNTLIKGCNNTVIPNSVTAICVDAFSGCSGLTSITIPDSVTTIDEGAFYRCSGLTSITIPNGVTIIGEGVFWGCSGLTSITIPSSVTCISSYAFEECSNLTTIYADAGSYAATWATENGYTVKPITTDTPTEDEKPTATPAAKGKTLTSKSKKCKVKVTSSSKKNPTVAYVKTTNTKATTVTVPDTVKIDDVTYKVTSVSDEAFLGNKKVKKVNVGKNVTSIGKDAFKNCIKLETVIIKSTSFKKIGATAFDGCKNLTKITLNSTKLTRSCVGKNALKGTNKKLVIKVPQDKVKAYKNYFEKKGNTKVTVKK